MKKFISLFLALVMIFTITTVAFAEGEDTGAENEAVTDSSSFLDDFNLEDTPVWVVKILSKLAVVVAKLVAVFAKLGFKAGLFDDLFESLKGYIGGEETNPSTPVTEANDSAPEEAPAALAA